MTEPDFQKGKNMCGIFGISGGRREDIQNLILAGLSSLQHRGQAGCGISVYDSKTNCIKHQTRLGLVTHLWEKMQSFDFSGDAGISHTRYGTSGNNILANVQPLLRELCDGHISIAHNGDLVSVDWGDETISITEAKNRLKAQGVMFASNSDTELLIPLIARSEKKDMLDKIQDAVSKVNGAFCLLILWNGYLIAVRDPWGFRPLWQGRLGEAHIFSSEDCAFPPLDIDPIQEILPGEMKIVYPNGTVSSRMLFKSAKRLSHCSFCHVYFASPYSTIFGESVSSIRQKLGFVTMTEAIASAIVPLDGKIVPILDSGLTSSLGAFKALLAHQLTTALKDQLPFSVERFVDNLSYGIGMGRNQYTGRNFITDDEEVRMLLANLKHIPDSHEIKDKDILPFDDSFVRGSTMAKHVKKFRRAGCRSVHPLIGSPRVFYPCHYGISTKKKGELAASRLDLEQTREMLGSESFTHLSTEGFRKCFRNPENYCMACFDGDYPVPIIE